MLAISKQQLGALTRTLDTLWPLAHADNAWDNTGLLLDLSKDVSSTGKVKLLLAIDLTQAVAQEAIQKDVNVIIAYHPYMFSKFNRISPQDPQKRSLIDLIQRGISVYCPHTAVDAAIGGVNDWLVKGLARDDILSGQRVIQEVKGAPLGVGFGRLITFENGITLKEAISRIKSSLGIDYVQYACIDSPETKIIKSVAICAGSGSGVFKGQDADLYYTGELSHHEALALKESGKAVVVCNHSNTERGYLTEMKRQLEAESNGQWDVSISQNDKEVYTTI